MTSRAIRAVMEGRDEPFDLPDHIEVGQILVVDGMEVLVEEIELRLDPDSREIVDATALLRPGSKTFPSQPTRAKTLEDGPCVVCTGA